MYAGMCICMNSNDSIFSFAIFPFRSRRGLAFTIGFVDNGLTIFLQFLILLSQSTDLVFECLGLLYGAARIFLQNVDVFLQLDSH